MFEAVIVSKTMYITNLYLFIYELFKHLNLSNIISYI